MVIAEKIMEEDKFDRGAADDGSCINIDDEYDVEFWMQELRVTRLQLAWAVKSDGPSVRAVRCWLAGGQRCRSSISFDPPI
jgi:hypothetical protein